MRIKRYVLAWALATSSLWVQARDYSYSDAHLHYVDFFQETAGMDTLLQAMASNRIEHVMMRMPIGTARPMCGWQRRSAP